MKALCRASFPLYSSTSFRTNDKLSRPMGEINITAFTKLSVSMKDPAQSYLRLAPPCPVESKQRGGHTEGSFPPHLPDSLSLVMLDLEPSRWNITGQASK